MTRLRSYREVGGGDRSGLAEQVASQRARVAERLADVRRIVAIMSGKGGVGKSFVTAGLALASAKRSGGGVGVLDADLHGPTSARLLEARGPLRTSAAGVEPVTGIGGVALGSLEGWQAILVGVQVGLVLLMIALLEHASRHAARDEAT